MCIHPKSLAISPQLRFFPDCSPGKPTRQSVSGCSTGKVLCCDNYACDPRAPGSNATLCKDDAFQRGLQKVFRSEWLINLLPNPSPAINLSRRTPICRYYFGPLWCPMPASIDALSTYVARWSREHGFDGVYLDEMFAPPDAAVRWPAILNETAFDSDGDGKADSVAALERQYSRYYPSWSASLRQKLGADAILLANGVGHTADPNLNGLTIEMESCVNVSSCEEQLEAQHNVSASPAMAVLWLTGSSPSNPPAKQCARVAQIQQKLPYVIAGTDFYDGSRVTCPPVY